ncbi:MAG: DUF3034 family protein [Candidatus Omnitrophota bacterium]
MKIAIVSVLVLIISVFLVFNARAGVPLNNLEGVGGIAFNPLAYTAGTKIESKVYSKPQFGAWYVNLNDVKIDWTSIGVAESLFNKRLEVSYGHEIISPNGKNIHKNNIGSKLLLLEENFNDLKFVPAVSVGTVWKHSSNVGAGIDDSDFDIYAVATKLVTQTPKPILLSGGVLSTKGWVTGALGFDKDRDETLFANVDVLPLENLAIGFEFKQGAKFKDFKNSNYWDAHAAWFVNKNLSLVAAYVNSGDHESTSKVGLGDGIVLSAQYAF